MSESEDRLKKIKQKTTYIDEVCQRNTGAKRNSSQWLKPKQF